ncbi:MAG: DUF5916 domain-containing protein [Gemmatimonadaceae bacterium]
MPLLPSFLVSLAMALSGQQPGAFAERDTTVVKSAELLRVAIPRVSEPPVLDGVLDDPVWTIAARLTDLVQYEPGDQLPASQPSVAWLAYDSTHIYFAFRAHEPSRDRVRATVFPRERGGDSDDRVTITLDTFLDERRAYELGMNPLGIQSDGVKIEGQDADESVDIVWYSEGRVHDEGWIVEAAIPFASLRFPTAESFSIGLNIVRAFGRTGEKAAWAPRTRGSPCDICQQGVIGPITGVGAGRTIDLLPYISASRLGERDFVYDATVQRDVPAGFAAASPDAAIGGDVRMALTPAIVANATINPDFSQVESDEEQIRVNRRFALFVQERRPFFLEGRDMFETQPTEDDFDRSNLGELFYSRAIADPSLGARVTGRRDWLTAGALYAHDDAPAYFHYDGAESSGVVPRLAAEADVAVARVRADLREGSHAGVLLLGRRGAGFHSGVADADFSVRQGSFTLSAEGALSVDAAPLVMQSDTIITPDPGGGTPDTVAVEGTAAGLDGVERRGRYYRAQLVRRGRHLSGAFMAAAAGPEFRNQLGRFQRVGIETYAARVEVTQYPNTSWLQRVEQTLSAVRTNQFGGGILDYSVDPRIELQFARQTSLGTGPHWEGITLFGTSLDMFGWFVDGETEFSRLLGGSLFLYVGDREIIDPNDPRAGAGYLTNASVVLRPVPRASIEARLERSIHYERWGGTLVDDAKILRLRGTLQFTRALGLRLIGEYSDQFDSKEADVADKRVVEYGASALVTYEIAPASFLYVGYNDALRDFAVLDCDAADAGCESPTTVGERRLRTGRQLFMKLSYLFRL